MRKNLCQFACAALSFLVIMNLAVPSYSLEFKILGLRQLGMGGAGVAMTDGSLAQYWNPGNLAFQKRFDLEVPVGASVEATGDILNKAKQISDASTEIQSLQSLQSASGNITQLQTVSNFYDSVSKINALNTDSSGALIGVQGGPNAHFGKLAVSVNNFTGVGAAPTVDLRFGLSGVSVPSGTGTGTLNDSSLTSVRDQLASVITNLSSSFSVGLNGQSATSIANGLINAAQGSLTNAQITSTVSQAAANQSQVTSVSSSGDLSANQSNVTLRGASLTEAAVSYGMPVPIPDALGKLGLGANVKLVQGRVGYSKIMLTNGQSTSGSSFLRDFVNNSKTTTRPSVDVGAQWVTPLPMNTRVGVVARNLNSPSFDQPAAGATAGEPSFKDSMQARAGVAVQPFRLLSLASDLDLTNNATDVPGFASRTWGAGAELNLWVLKLRAGIMRNITGATPLAYTAGVGLRIFALAFDLGGSISSKTVKFNDGATVPATLAFGAQISLLFGR